MPLPSEHSCRLRNPDDFKSDSFRRTTRKHNGKEYSIIMGRLKDEDTMTEQAYRYNKEVWDAADARSHCKEHDGSFEAAQEEKGKELDLEYRYSPLSELRIVEANEQLPKITGYAAVFEKFSEFMWGWREKIIKGAFSDTIRDDDIRAFVNHEPSAILGRNKAGTLKLKEDDSGLFFEIVPPDTSLARDTIISIKRGDLSGASFAFTTIIDEWTKKENDEVSTRTLKKVKLHDVSIVAFPAYPDTSIAVRSLNEWKKSQEEIIEETKQDHARHMRLRLEEET